MITYRASLDVDRDTVAFLACLLRARRRQVGTRRGRRALTCWWHAVLVLRWFRGQGVRAADLAGDHGIASATGSPPLRGRCAPRYLREGISVLAAQAPDLHQELEAAKDAGA